jgi:hypothetical protein
MGIMLRRLKKFILKKQIERCLDRQNEVAEIIQGYNRTIIMMVLRGISKFRIERVKRERKKYYDESYKLMDQKYELMGQLRRA